MLLHTPCVQLMSATQGYITSLRPRPLRLIAQRLVDSLNTYVLQLLPSSRDIFRYLNSLETTTFFFSLFKAGVYYILAWLCQLIAIFYYFLYLNYPLCTISYKLLLYMLYLPPFKTY